MGKSTVAVNLAYTLAGMGARVGIFDADVYGPSLPTMVSPENRLLEMVLFWNSTDLFFYFAWNCSFDRIKFHVEPREENYYSYWILGSEVGVFWICWTRSCNNARTNGFWGHQPASDYNWVVWSASTGNEFQRIKSLCLLELIEIIEIELQRSLDPTPHWKCGCGHIQCLTNSHHVGASWITLLLTCPLELVIFSLPCARYQLFIFIVFRHKLILTHYFLLCILLLV